MPGGDNTTETIDGKLDQDTLDAIALDFPEADMFELQHLNSALKRMEDAEGVLPEAEEFQQVFMNKWVRRQWNMDTARALVKVAEKALGIEHIMCRGCEAFPGCKRDAIMDAAELMRERGLLFR